MFYVVAVTDFIITTAESALPELLINLTTKLPFVAYAMSVAFTVMDAKHARAHLAKNLGAQAPNA